MSKGLGLDIDSRAVDEYLNEIADSELRHKLLMTATGKVASNVKKLTQKNFILKLPSANRKGTKYNDTLKDAVRIAKDKISGEYKVHIMGTRKKGSGTFRAKFFEKPLQPRRQKTGGKRYTGVIKKNTQDYFKEVRENTGEHDRIFSNTLTDYLSDINKLRKLRGY